METKRYNYLSDYADNIQSQGKYSFTSEELLTNLSASENAIKKSIRRLKEKHEIAKVRNGFYVIIPPEYRRRGMLPPMLFVKELMKFLKRDYYVCLINAAAIHGASHQQPQEFFVMTTKPVMLPIHNLQVKINFIYRKKWSTLDIMEKKTETGMIKISTPELTALDLVNYYDRSGGLNRVATVLEELAERLDAERLAAAAARYGQVATIQRLGYLLDKVLGKKNITGPLADYLSRIHYSSVPLRPDNGKSGPQATNNRWKVIPNTEIETDDL